MKTEFDINLRESMGSLASISNRNAEKEQTVEANNKIVDQNNINEGLVYLQISRGKAERDFAFPKPEVEPTIVLFTQKKTLVFR